MQEDKKELEALWFSQLIVLGTHTLFSVALGFGIWLMDWEKWAILVLAANILTCWTLHLKQAFTAQYRLNIYVILQMVTFFYYGVHPESIYTLSPIMCLLLMEYCVCNTKWFVHVGVATFVVTYIYEDFTRYDSISSLNGMSIASTLLNLGIVGISAWVSKLIIRGRTQYISEFKERIELLEMTNRRTEDFLANVSHELRTPINAVTGISTLLLKNENSPRKRINLTSIHRAGLRLYEQIDDILDHTELDTGRMVISDEQYMVSSLINDLILEMRSDDRGREMDVIYDVDASTPATLIGDSRKIRKILRHLIDNALKFTKQGGVMIEIKPIRKHYGINLFIKVTDTGIGMSKDQIEKITERYFQVDASRSRSVGGLGLGLSIVHGLTHAMSGFMHISSKEGEGTSVQVSIPQRVADPTPCIIVEDTDSFCLACYLNLDKFLDTDPTKPQRDNEQVRGMQVRNFYNKMISHMIRDIRIPIYRVSAIQELMKLIERYQLTHLLISWNEYIEDTAYFDRLSRQMHVLIVTDEGTKLPEESNARIICKPISSFGIVNILNASRQNAAAELYLTKRMYCPGVRALVVDDEIMNLVVAKGILKEYQISVTTAGSGLEALEICEREHFDIIFLDHMMPEMDGIETMKRLRDAEADKDLTIVALTANAVSGAREMFLSEGFDEFVSKPIETIELERVLRKVLKPAQITYVDENPIGTYGTEDGDEERPGSFKVSVSQSFQDFGTVQKLKMLRDAGIDTSAGIHYCMGDEQLYLSLLREFADGETEEREKMEDFIKHGNVHDFYAAAHSVRGTAALIGADELYNAARGSEDAIDVIDVSDAMSMLSVSDDSDAQSTSNLDLAWNTAKSLIEKYKALGDTLERILGPGKRSTGKGAAAGHGNGAVGTTGSSDWSDRESGGTGASAGGTEASASRAGASHGVTGASGASAGDDGNPEGGSGASFGGSTGQDAASASDGAWIGEAPALGPLDSGSEGEGLDIPDMDGILAELFEGETLDEDYSFEGYAEAEGFGRKEPNDPFQKDISRLKNALNAFEEDPAEQAIKSILEYDLRPEYIDLFESMLQDVQDFDLSAAARKLQAAGEIGI